ncbi:hypothetical protein EUX98_g1314 [Antrodiella citrinella]|uniref:Uncharacterized protein n=1 Tax=Antrodiella citrinella TaxID=2447956 RepID=A0A4V3XJE8_9APHY|nr:hypothetical protein EUX98_g1314 [Antrodiella citrinella]
MFAKFLVPSTLLLAATSVQGLNFARDSDWFHARDVAQTAKRTEVEARNVFAERSILDDPYYQKRDFISDLEAALPGLIQLLPPDIQGPAMSIVNEVASAIGGPSAQPTNAVPDPNAAASAVPTSSVNTDPNPDPNAAGAPAITGPASATPDPNAAASTPAAGSAPTDTGVVPAPTSNTPSKRTSPGQAGMAAMLSSFTASLVSISSSLALSSASPIAGPKEELGRRSIPRPIQYGRRPRNVFAERSILDDLYYQKRDIISDLEAALPGLIQLLPPSIQGPAMSIVNEVASAIGGGSAQPTNAVPDPNAAASAVPTSASTDPNAAASTPAAGSAPTDTGVVPAPTSNTPSKRTSPGQAGMAEMLSSFTASLVSISSSLALSSASPIAGPNVLEKNSGDGASLAPYSMVAVLGCLFLAAAFVL